MIEGLLSPMHLLLILAVALLVLGPKRLPEAGRGLGSAIRGFKDSLSTPNGRDDERVIEKSHEPDHTSSARVIRPPETTLAQRRDPELADSQRGETRRWPGTTT